MTSATTPFPLQISEIILHTSNYEALKQWYVTLFGGMQPAVESDCRNGLHSAPHVKRMCFLRIHASFPFTQGDCISHRSNFVHG